MSAHDPADRAAPPSSLPGEGPPRAAVDIAREIVPITSDALFGRASEVRIAHRGAIYRLKQTSLGKLILTK